MARAVPRFTGTDTWQRRFPILTRRNIGCLISSTDLEGDMVPWSRCVENRCLAKLDGKAQAYGGTERHFVEVA